MEIETERQEEAVGTGDHVVREGECVASIAEAAGLLPETIWDHPDNQALKERRGQPNLLLPGDRLVVPDRRRLERPAASGQRHSFVRKNVSTRFRMQVLDCEAPCADEEFVLAIGPRSIDGTLDGDGCLDVQIPGSARSGTLFVGGGRLVYELDFGGLNPLETTSGLQARLENLGYSPGKIDGDPGERTQQALMRFQLDEGLDATGEIDDATRDALRSRHGS